VCKQELLELFGLSHDHLDRPLIGIVSRFADQKGFDLIAEKAHELMREDLVPGVLGTGERKYEDFFKALAAAYRPRGREDRLRQRAGAQSRGGSGYGS